MNVYSLLFEKKNKKNVLKANLEEILFLERLPRARFETEWNTDNCVSSIPHIPQQPPLNNSYLLDTNKTYPKRSDYLFSFILNLDLFTLALENLHFNTLDQKKVQGMSLGYIKSQRDTSSALHTHATGSRRRGMKEPHAGCRPLL